MKKRWSNKYDCCQNPNHDFYGGGDSPHMAHGECVVCYQRELMKKRRAKKKEPFKLTIHGKPVGDSEGIKVLEYFLSKKPILTDVRKTDTWVREIDKFMKDMGVKLEVMKQYINYLVEYSWVADKNTLKFGHLVSRPTFVDWLSNHSSPEKLPAHIQKINQVGEDYLNSHDDTNVKFELVLMKAEVFAEGHHIQPTRDFNKKDLQDKLLEMPLYDALLELGWKSHVNETPRGKI
jgi:hypothetical protein